MPSPLVVTPRRSALLLILTLLALPIASALAQGPAGKAKLVITGNDQALYPVMAMEPPVEDAAAKFEEALRAEKERNPDAYFVEAGGFVSLAVQMETAYNFTSAKLFHELGYDVVNLTPRDFALSSVASVGYFYAPRSFRDPVINNLTSDFCGSGQTPLDHAISRNAEKEGQLPVTFLSMGDPARLAGFSTVAATVTPRPLERLAEAATKARQASRLVVGFNSYPPATLENLTALPDLLVDANLPRDSAPVQRGNTWHIPEPAPGAYLRVSLERDAEGNLLEPKVEREQVVEIEHFRDFIDFPVPEVGHEIPNLDATMRIFFGVSADAVQVDRVGNQERDDLTALPNPTVYHTRLEEKPVRIYRVRSEVPDWRWDGRRATGWPTMDSLIALGEGSTLVRVESRSDRFVMSMLETSMLEALNRLSGVPQDQWTPDPRLAAGLEEFWGWHTDVIRKVMELDGLLYGPDGVYRLPE